MNDPSIKIMMDTLRQAEQCLNDAGHRVSASRLNLLTRALYRRPHIWELAQNEMSKILMEDTRGMWQEMVDDEASAD